MHMLLCPCRINRNIVECKSLSSPHAASMLLRINRNIVECKSESVLEKIDTSTGINRNIVECKFIYELIVNDGEK